MPFILLYYPGPCVYMSLALIGIDTASEQNWQHHCLTIMYAAKQSISGKAIYMHARQHHKLVRLANTESPQHSPNFTYAIISSFIYVCYMLYNLV